MEGTGIGTEIFLQANEGDVEAANGKYKEAQSLFHGTL